MLASIAELLPSVSSCPLLAVLFSCTRMVSRSPTAAARLSAISDREESFHNDCADVTNGAAINALNKPCRPNRNRALVTACFGVRTDKP